MNYLLPILSSLLLVLSGQFAFAKDVIPACDRAVESDVSRREVVGGLDLLPKMLLVGRVANHMVEVRDNNQTILLHGRQSFINAKSEILCATSNNKNVKVFSLYAPTLIDLSKKEKSATSFWQFQLMANSTQVGIWNAKSRIESKSASLEKFLKSTGAQIKVYQISHDQYELVLSKIIGNQKELLSIIYDVTK